MSCIKNAIVIDGKSKDLKIITRRLIVEGEESVLCRTTDWKGDTIFLTIPYKYIDKNGKLIKPMNGLDMCIEYCINEAIEARRRSILIRKFVRENPKCKDEELIKFILHINNIES